MSNRLLIRKPYTVILLSLALISAAFLLAGCQGKSNQAVTEAQLAATNNEAQLADSVSPPPTTIEVPAGTAITIRLLQALSSQTANPGDDFDAEIANPIVVEGNTVIPVHTSIRGRIVDAKQSGRLEDPGYLSVALNSMKTTDGNWLDIKTNIISRKGTSHKKRNLTMIGGGAGVGTLIGAIAGGGKGAAIGAAAGAGAGTAGAYATGKKDVSIPVEGKLTFRLEREISLVL